MLYIFTLNYNGASKLGKLAPTLFSNLKNIDYKWVIKDNGSTDASIDLISFLQKSMNIDLIETGHNNDNFAEGMNICFNHIKPNDEDLILLLNNDIIINDYKSISNMIELLLSTDDIGVVGARLMYPSPDDNLNQHVGVVFINNKLPIHFKSKTIINDDLKKNRYFQAVTGAVWLTKAKYYKNICKDNKSKIDGLCEEFIWCYEDIDACLSILYNQNKKIAYCGSTNISHEESATLKKTDNQRKFLLYNVNLFKKKWENIVDIDVHKYMMDINYNRIT